MNRHTRNVLGETSVRENGEGAGGGWQSCPTVMQVWAQGKETQKEGWMDPCQTAVQV